MSKSAAPIHARAILKLLRTRHADDVFVPECKDGSTHFASHLRFDAWVMRRSWTKPCLTGYEIKVSRDDFLRDEKWPNYLPLCNEFYFACAPGVVSPDELPKEVGLLEAAKTGGRMLCKKKAPYRKIDIPESVYQYVLMHRARIIEEHDAPRRAAPDYWEQWLQQRDEKQNAGHRLSVRVALLVHQRTSEIQARNKVLEEKNAELESAADLLVEYGLVDAVEDPATGKTTYKSRGYAERERRVRKLAGFIDHQTEWAIRAAQRSLDNLMQRIESEKSSRANTPEPATSPANLN